jgi:hypothetical protein
MRVIKLHRAADLSGTMKAMRLWLDDHRCQPHRFTCDHMPGWHVIRVDLSEDNKADAFKAQFGGSEEKSGEGTMSKVFRWPTASPLHRQSICCSMLRKRSIEWPKTWSDGLRKISRGAIRVSSRCEP